MEKKFGVLSEVLAEYHEAHDLLKIPIKVVGLTPILTKRSGLARIFLESYDLPNGGKPDQILARVMVHKKGTGAHPEIDGDYARVQYSSAINLSLRRFAVCKELWQVILDQTKEERVGDIETLTRLGQWLFSEDAFRVEDFKPGNTEFEAEILALETLFPLELRSRPEFMDALDNGKLGLNDLADQFKLPPHYVEQAMSDFYFSWASEQRGNGRVKLK